VREWLSPVVNGCIVDDEGQAEEEAEVYQLRVFQEGAKALQQGLNVDAMEEVPEQAQPVSTRSSTPVLGAKQKKRSASVLVDVPTFPSSVASSPASAVSTEAASSSPSFSTPLRSKRARLSPLPSPSASSSSAFTSSPMEDEQEEGETKEQSAAAPSAASTLPASDLFLPPLSPSGSVYELASEADQAPYQPVDGLPVSPLRQPQTAAVSASHPSLSIDLSVMNDDAALCAYSSPIPFAYAATASPVRSPSRPSFLQSARALSFDLSVVASPMIGPQNADSAQGTSAPLLLSPNMHAHCSVLLSPLSSPLSQPQQSAAPFRASDDGACMLGPLQTMFDWDEATAAFPTAANGPMHPNALFQ